MTTTSDMPMDEHRLTTPIAREDLDKLKPGDIVRLDGIIFTGRIGVYKKLFEEKIPPPVDIESLTNVTFHCSPAVREKAPGEWEVTRSSNRTCGYPASGSPAGNANVARVPYFRSWRN